MEWFHQIDDRLWRLWAYLTTGPVLAIVLGVGFALLAITLLIASRTKWGQTKPLTKCVALSVMLHVWFLMYAIGNRIILPQGDTGGRDKNISVSFEGSEFEGSEIDSLHQNLRIPETLSLPEKLASESAQHEAANSELPPWEKPAALDALPKPPELTSLDLSNLSAPPLLPALEPTPLPALPPPDVLADLSKPEATAEESSSFDSSSQLASDSLNPLLPPTITLPPLAAAPVSNNEQPSIQNLALQSSPVLPPIQQLPPSNTLPREYQLRQAPNRLQLAKAFGADEDTEAAVEAGLQWLSQAQSQDGSWNAAQFGAGTETNALGENRYGTGLKADTGVSGLALLAFLSAGHTHRDGQHQHTVRLGLEYLLAAQMPSGDLSGPKQVGSERNVLFAKMYCHSIATLALAEAHAMTLDVGLRDALLRAAKYSINAQDVRGGGWRYRPLDPGDLSQFGWQAMALKSVERSGTPIPAEVQRRMRRFLDSCSAGQSGGLATYKPSEGRPSETMTAEALACRLLLNYPLSLDAQREATNMIIRSRPGTGEDNVYFWYYATLALFQLQDENWRAWNQAMKARLLTTQIPAYGEQPGSWTPDNLWGGYGGRVYATAMGCLCLEVYYRYLPMYQRANLARTPAESGYSR